jgi:hypothetical protein
MHILTRESLPKIARSGAAAMMVVGGVGALSASAALASQTQRSTVKTPKVPIVIDGVRHAPQAIHQFDGQNIHLRLRRGPNGKPELVISRKSPRLGGTRATASSVGGHVTFFEHIGSGHSLTLAHGESRTNLASVPLDCFLWWWCSGSWDNIVSSVETGGAHTVLFDRPNLDRRGRTLEIPDEWTRVNLIALGFNDMASSVLVD